MRPLRVLSIAVLAFVVLFASNARGDFGRNGGIVVLPSAVPFPQSGKELRGSYLFSAGQVLCAQLPQNLRNAVFAATAGGGMPLSLGRIQGDQFVVSGQELAGFAAAGVRRLDVRMVDANGMALHLRVLIDPEGSFALQVW